MVKQVLTGLVGWRGMVGSVLLERMRAEGDFALIEPVFFSTSNAGGAAPAEAKNESKLCDAYDIAALKRCEIVITAQGGEYTKKVYPELRAAGWKGYWIDAAKTLRMQDDAVIILDPVNLQRHPGRAEARRARLHRRQLHGELHADGRGRAVQGRPGRVDDMHHLPGRIRRRRAAHARAADAVRHAAHRGARPAARPGVGDPGDRPQGGGEAACAGRRRSRQLRRAAGRQPDPLDRCRPRRRHQPGRVEGRRRDQQDPRPRPGLWQRRPRPSIRSACVSAPCAATARR